MGLGGGGAGREVAAFVNEDAELEVDGRVPVEEVGRVPVDEVGRVPVVFVNEVVPTVDVEGLV